MRNCILLIAWTALGVSCAPNRVGFTCESDADCADGRRCAAEGVCVTPEVEDGGAPDAGAVDAGAVDAGAVDAGAVDAGAVDAGAVDAGAVDAGAVDAGAVDGGPFAWPDGFDFRWPLQLPPAPQGLTNFPAVVSLLLPPPDLVPDSLRFVDENWTVLRHSIVENDSASGRLVAWVRLAYVPDASSQVYAFAARSLPVGLPPASQDVFTEDYDAVWHFDGTRPATDATGTVPDALLTSGAQVPGVVGDAVSFSSGSGSFVIAPDGGVDVLRGAGSATVSAWVTLAPDAGPTDVDTWTVVSVAVGGVPGANASRLALLIGEDYKLILVARRDASDTVGFRAAGPTIPTGTPVHIAARVNFTTGAFRFYVNGTSDDGTELSSGTVGQGPVEDLSAGSVGIGAEGDGSQPNFNGVIDEVRIAGALRNGIWLAFERDADQGTLVQVGTREDR